MRSVFYLILLLTLVFIIFNCRNSQKSGLTPDIILFAESSADTSRYERGINSVPEKDAVFLEWQTVRDENVKNVLLHRSDLKGGPYIQIGTAAAKDTSYIDETVEIETRYYYYALAESRDGVRSAPSDTIHYKLVKKAVDLAPSGITHAALPELSWKDPNMPPEVLYMLRLQETETEKWIWNARIPTTYEDRISAVFNHDGKAAIDSLEKNVEYRWRIDIIGSQAFSGSKSAWQSLIIH